MIRRVTTKEELQECYDFMKIMFPETFKRKMKTMQLDSQHILVNKDKTYWCILDSRDKYCIKLAYHAKNQGCQVNINTILLQVIAYCKKQFTKKILLATVRSNNAPGINCLINVGFQPIFECKIVQNPAIKFIKIL